MWVAGFRVVDACWGLIFGREKWKTMGGGVWVVVGVAEGTGRPFLSPATGGSQR